MTAGGRSEEYHMVQHTGVVTPKSRTVFFEDHEEAEAVHFPPKSKGKRATKASNAEALHQTTRKFVLGINSSAIQARAGRSSGTLIGPVRRKDLATKSRKARARTCSRASFMRRNERMPSRTALFRPRNNALLDGRPAGFGQPSVMRAHMSQRDASPSFGPEIGSSSKDKQGRLFRTGRRSPAFFACRL